MKHKLRNIIILLIFITLFIIISFNAGRFLTVNDSPVKSDVIIVLSGDTGERTIQAVKLYKQHYAGKIIMSGGIVYGDVTMAKLMKDHAVQLGVDSSDIIVEDKAESTYENGLFSKNIIQKYGFKSAIVVTSNYHMRRTKLTFDRLFKGTDIKLSYSSCGEDNFNPDKWWSSNKSIMLVITEYIKLTGYALGKNS